MLRSFKKTIYFILILTVFNFTHTFAASMFLVPEQKVVGLKEKIIVNVLIDSAGRGFNVAQATIRFPKDLLTASEPDTKKSALTFWLEQPTALNNEGVISFIGGAPFGISGGSIQILRLEFTPKGVGTGTISIVDAAISASDGSGANIVSTTTDTTITISPTKVTSPAVITSIPSTSTSSVITRVPVQASGLPSLPKVNISLYPDENSWYSSISPFTVSWSLPTDISGINTEINRQSNFTPETKSKGLFDSESFNALSDGTWYLHVRFKNNIGWGPTLHRKILVDTVPPVGFNVEQIDIKDKFYPISTLRFKTNDALSGLKEYIISIDRFNQSVIPIKDFPGQFVTKPLVPGTHNVTIQAVDFAGNSIISSSTVNIVAIDSPIITFLPENVYSNDNHGLTIEGEAKPNSIILVELLKDAGESIETGTTPVDAKGRWSYTSKEALPIGSYIYHIKNKDEFGALSEEVMSKIIIIEEKPIVQFGIFKLGLRGTIILLLAIIAIGMGGGWWLYRKRQDILFMRLLTTESDMGKVFSMIRTDLSKFDSKTMTPDDIKLTTERLNDNVNKMERYLKSEIQNINK